MSQRELLSIVGQFMDVLVVDLNLSFCGERFLDGPEPLFFFYVTR